MATLNVPAIAKYAYRPELLANKVMQLDGKSSTFHTEDGTFEATGIIINNDETLRTPGVMPSKVTELANLMLSFAGQKGNTIQLKGHYTGQARTVTIPVTKLTKTEEFGGQPAGGKKENLGLKFERDLSNALVDKANGKKPAMMNKLADELLAAVCKQNPSPIQSIKQMGGANESRPFIMNGGKVMIGPDNAADVGKKLTDITCFHANRTETYLSAKFSSTLTFVNTGVKGPGKPFTEVEVKNGIITNEMGVKLLRALGIDNATFCAVFNLYGTGKKATGTNSHIIDVTNEIDKPLLTSLLQSAIGANYWMVHGQGGEKAYCWWVGVNENKAYSNVSASKFTLYYGGITNGTAKRIDMKFSNQYFDFKLNIRNKQGGVAPTHFLLDYVSKAATGKKLLG